MSLIAQGSPLVALPFAHHQIILLPVLCGKGLSHLLTWKMFGSFKG